MLRRDRNSEIIFVKCINLCVFLSVGHDELFSANKKEIDERRLDCKGECQPTEPDSGDDASPICC